MNWYQLSIAECAANEVEAFCEQLQTWGALSISLRDEHDNPVLEPEPGETPLWPTVTIDALFDDQDIQEHALKLIQQHYPKFTIKSAIIADQDWARAWMKDFHPMQFGRRLWVCPNWSEPPDPNAVNLHLDPGLAFGSGTHPTTTLCLEFLDNQNLTGKTVIDYGCGSGILAIAALKLGARFAHAIDIDDQALTATQANAESNQIAPENLCLSFPDATIHPSDILLANILAKPLIELQPLFLRLLKPRGLLALSGILAEQANLLIQTYEVEFNLVKQVNREDWTFLLFQRKN